MWQAWDGSVQSVPAYAMPRIYRLIPCLVLTPLVALGAATEYLVRNGQICDGERTMCIRGTLAYYPNPRIIELRGRVAHAPGPGWVKILFAGNSNGQRASSVMEIPIRGHHSEIIDRRFIPDNPAIRHWRVLSVRFEPDERADRAATDR